MVELCCPHATAAQRYLAAELNDELASAFESHLLSCDVCTGTVARALEVGAQPDWLLLARAHRPAVLNAHSFNRCDTPGGTLTIGGHRSASSVPQVSETAPDRLAPAPEATVRYEWTHQIGAGGMGVVWAGRDHLMQRSVALKRLSPQNSDFSNVQRLLQEATALAQLAHPNIVAVHEVITEQQYPAVVMELVDGLNLAQWQQNKPVDPLVAAEICLVIANALHHAHCHGIIHRDIKPSNVLLATQEHALLPRDDAGMLLIKLSDFGLARVGESAMLTLSGQTPGTPCYMAPEQIAPHGALDARADVYGAGVLLYELLTGHPPFIARDAASVFTMIQQQDPVSPRRVQPQVSRDLETICLKCLARHPGDRYASAELLAADLRALLRGDPIQARPLSPLAWTLRWAARNRARAALLLSVTSTLIATAVASVIVAENQRELRIRAEQAEQRAIRSASQEKASRQRAELAERQALSQAEAEAQLRRQQQELMLQAVTLVDIELRSARDSGAPLTARNPQQEMDVGNRAANFLEDYLQKLDRSQPLSWRDLEVAVRYLGLRKFGSNQMEVGDEIARVDEALKFHENTPEEPLKFVDFRRIRNWFFPVEASSPEHYSRICGDEWLRLAEVFRKHAETSPEVNQRVSEWILARQAALREAAYAARNIGDPDLAQGLLLPLAAAASEPLPHAQALTDVEKLVRIAALTQLAEIQLNTNHAVTAVETAKTALDGFAGLSGSAETSEESAEYAKKLGEILRIAEKGSGLFNLSERK